MFVLIVPSCVKLGASTELSDQTISAVSCKAFMASRGRVSRSFYRPVGWINLSRTRISKHSRLTIRNFCFFSSESLDLAIRTSNASLLTMSSAVNLQWSITFLIIHIPRKAMSSVSSTINIDRFSSHELQTPRIFLQIFSL